MSTLQQELNRLYPAAPGKRQLRHVFSEEQMNKVFPGNLLYADGLERLLPEWQLDALLEIADRYELYGMNAYCTTTTEQCVGDALKALT